MKPEEIEYLQLVTNHQSLLRGYIYSIAPSVSADDVLQETNIILWEKMSHFTLGTNFKAFACRIAYLKTMESIRKMSRNNWLVFDSDIVENIDTYFSKHPDNKNETQAALLGCLQKLKEHERDLISQRYVNGKTVRSIAQEANKNEGALQQAFFRIHNALRQCISQHLNTSSL